MAFMHILFVKKKKILIIFLFTIKNMQQPEECSWILLQRSGAGKTFLFQERWGGIKGIKSFHLSSVSLFDFLWPWGFNHFTHLDDSQHSDCILCLHWVAKNICQDTWKTENAKFLPYECYLFRQITCLFLSFHSFFSLPSACSLTSGRNLN